MDFILICLSFVFALVWSLIFSREQSIFPDGPRPLPFIGNLLDFSALYANPDKVLYQVARKYGKICMLWFGSKPVIIVSSPEAAKELMDKVRL